MNPSVSRPVPFLGPRMVLIAMLAMNVATGLTFGSFGALVLPIAERFGAAKSIVSLDIALVILSHGLIAPFTQALVARFSIRWVMVAGALLSALGYGVLAAADSSLQMLLIFGLLIGPGGALMGTVPAFMLVTNWYGHGQGRALGFVSMPLVVMVAPLLIVWLIPLVGLSGAVLALGLGFLMTIPFLLLVIDRPDMVGHDVRPDDREEAGVPHHHLREREANWVLLRNPLFLALTLASGLVMGAAISKAVHFMPMLIERGVKLEFAALLLSISGGAGIAGSLLFGYLADRLNAGRVLAVNVAIQGVVWIIPLLTIDPGLLLVDAVLIGLCGGGFVNAHAVLARRQFGLADFGRVMGLTSLMTTPFLFAMNPIAGLLRDQTGNYELAILSQSAGFFVAIFCLLYAARSGKALRPLRVRGEPEQVGPTST